MEVSNEEISHEIEEEIKKRFPRVGDFSTHPVNELMAKLVVRKDEISWVEPKEYGCRTQYTVEKVVDRATIAKQLAAYEKCSYIRKVSTWEKVSLSTLLPVLKPDGRFRFTTDFRKLNKYFSHEGTTQVDVWRKLREIDK